MAETEKSYKAEQIKVLEGLEGVRRDFHVIELSKKIKKQGDLLVLSHELKIKPRILKSAYDEGRVLSILPDIKKSKAGILASLRTDREIKLFSERNDIKNISPKKLRELVKKWREDIQKNPLMFISQKEHDLIIGSLLGDASIRQREKNCCFRVAHSLNQEKYIHWKLDLLKNFYISEFVERKRIINKREVNMIYLATKTHQAFNYYRNLFYKNGKKIITKDILKKINPRSLAVWVCDDGSYSSTQGYIILCTNSYSLEEHRLIKEFFEDKFSLSPTIGFRDGKYYYLRFKKDDTQKLIKIIKPFITESMIYKIGGPKNDSR